MHDNSYIPVETVKKITKPKFTLQEAEHKFLNRSYFFPGHVTWDPVTVTFVDDATTKFVISTGASADSGPINISLPDEGVRFGTNLKVNISANGASAVTCFFA